MAKKLYVSVNNTAQEVSKMYVSVNGVAKQVKKAYASVNGVARLVYDSSGGGLEIVDWGTGTDSQILAMVQAADRGEINLTDYWHVGDKRVVQLSAIPATGVQETHAAQSVTLVLMNAGGKTLATPTESGRTTCSFIFGLEDCLNEFGKLNNRHTNSGSWPNCLRRPWCNGPFKDAFPPTFARIFKQFENKTSAGSRSTNIVTSIDWFAMPSEVEVTGGTGSSFPGEGSIFTWYETASNRIKRVDGITRYYFTRSPFKSNNSRYVVIRDNGYATYGDPDGKSGLSPFGVF